MIHRYFRCASCNERWLVSYNLRASLFNFWKVQAELADVETDYYNHQADHILEKAEEVINTGGMHYEELG